MNLSGFKNQFTAILVVFLICATVLGSTLIVRSTKFYIKNIGTGVTDEGEVINSISVTGDGKVYAKPDMVEFNVSVSELKPTSKDALNAVNEKIADIKKKLKAGGVKDDDIKTQNLSLSPEYDYRNGQSYLEGQRATQSLNVTLKKIDEKASKVADLIDSVSEINNVYIGWIRFDIEDKQDYFSQARELAFNKAKQKAAELADLADVELLDPVSISDASADYASSYTQQNVARSYESTDEVQTQISTGQLEISIRLNVKFGIG
ncbi:MAG: SIMPL domain-containing protein [Candidatus Dojkabacteria bacterium]|nr:SIMPL domain-containing protein [Candidatus Dojkabacteria bacterium]